MTDYTEAERIRQEKGALFDGLRRQFFACNRENKKLKKLLGMTPASRLQRMWDREAKLRADYDHECAALANASLEVDQLRVQLAAKDKDLHIYRECLAVLNHDGGQMQDDDLYIACDYAMQQMREQAERVRTLREALSELVGMVRQAEHVSGTEAGTNTINLCLTIGDAPLRKAEHLLATAPDAEPARTKGGDVSHWPGCWKSHADCADKLIADMAAFIDKYVPKEKQDGWWCPECQDVIGCASRDECCTHCGTYLGDCQPENEWIDEARTLVARAQQPDSGE